MVKPKIGEVRSGILEEHQNWDKAFQIKLRHIETLTQFSQKLFFTMLAAFGAVMVTIITISPFILQTFGIYPLLSALLILFVASLAFLFASQYFIEGKIHKYYNKLFYEIMVGKIDDIEGMTNEKYREITEHLHR